MKVIKICGIVWAIIGVANIALIDYSASTGVLAYIFNVVVFIIPSIFLIKAGSDNKLSAS